VFCLGNKRKRPNSKHVKTQVARVETAGRQNLETTRDVDKGLCVVSFWVSRGLHFARDEQMTSKLRDN
jgi:hypothetical protein